MDALKIPAVDRPRASREPSDSNGLGTSEVSLTPQMQTALAALGEALDYAHDLGASPWEFAVELASLRRLKLSNADLQWLFVHGLVEHAIETTGNREENRNFRHCEQPLFEKRSCFVLTASGATLAHALREDEADESCNDSDESRNEVRDSRDERAVAERRNHDPLKPPPTRSPKWDRDRHELRVGAVVVKRFTIPSANQEAILAAFEEESWPQRLEDPLPHSEESSRKARLNETINLLNRAQRRLLVRFLGDGSGLGICWELCADEANCPHA